MTIRAITLDLDDTLWPIEPAMLRAEQTLDAWLKEHCPRTAAAYPIVQMRALRDRVADEHPHLSHDFTAQRRLSLRAALLPHGYDEGHVDAAFSAFYAARNEVEYYPDVLPALARLAAHYPLVSVSNGNADLGRIGLKHFFRASISARECGVAKPAAEIFHVACAELGLPPEAVLHVGDDPDLDVAGANRAGLRSAWLNRNRTRWEHAHVPDLQVSDLAELADALESGTVKERFFGALA